MRDLSKRRTFVTKFGAATVFTLSGCSAVSSSDSSRSDGVQTRSTSTPNPTIASKTATESLTATNTSGPRGELIEDFEGRVESRWEVITGTYSVDRQNPYQGSQSAILHGRDYGTNGESKAVGISRSFAERGGLDLRHHDLSMALKFEQPVDGYIGIELVAPSDSNSLSSLHYIPIELDGWTRFDLGYTRENGTPVLKNVLEIRIVVNTAGDPITVAIDDIRKIPKPKTGKVMFQFDDSHITTYTEAFPRLKQHNWSGGVAVIPESINSTDNMTISHMHEMRDAGWDMMSHPHPSVAKPLPQLPVERQERLIRQSKQYLVRQGFEQGARHVVAPFGRVSKETIEIMRKYHQANYLFGGTPANAQQPSNMYGISRVFGTAPMTDINALLDLAERYNQMIVLEYHEIGGNTSTSVPVEKFETVLGYIEKKDMEVVSPSQFLDSSGT